MRRPEVPFLGQSRSDRQGGQRAAYRERTFAMRITVTVPSLKLTT
jgi:hypothetical protein